MEDAYGALVVDVTEALKQYVVDDGDDESKLVLVAGDFTFDNSKWHFTIERDMSED